MGKLFSSTMNLQGKPSRINEIYFEDMLMLSLSFYKGFFTFLFLPLSRTAW